MGLLKWLIIIGFGLWALSKISSQTSKPMKNTKKSTASGAVSYSKEDILAEAQEIADKVKTPKQFSALEERLDKAQDRAAEAESDKAIANAERKARVLEEALSLAGNKAYGWQFIPDLDLTIPKKLLENAYKVFSPADYEKAKIELSSDDRDWYKLDAWDEPEELELDVKSLLKFREIVESDLPQDVRERKVNELVDKDDTLAEFFDSEDVLSPGQQWFAMVLKEDGLPKAEELYAEGYTTPEACLEIDPNEFLKRKGVGPKTVEKLKQYQEKVRGRLSQ